MISVQTFLVTPSAATTSYSYVFWEKSLLCPNRGALSMGYIVAAVEMLAYPTILFKETLAFSAVLNVPFPPPDASV